MDKMLLPTAFEQKLQRHVRKIQQLKPTGKPMTMAMAFLMLSTGLVLVNGATPGSDLSLLYYDGLCPGFGTFATIKFINLTDSIVGPFVTADPGLAPALMRLAFHDCFVQGCDASVLLDSISDTLPAEKTSPVNLSLRGFEVIDAVKAALELVCAGVFSCADIVQEVALAAQRYVVQTKLKSQWPLRYGRRDGLVSLATEAAQFIPRPDMNYTQLVASFAAQGLNRSDLVHLSGAHTFGVCRCVSFTQRLYNFSGDGSGTDPALDATYAANLKAQCPPGSSNVVNLDPSTPTTFDNEYYNNIAAGKVPLFSDDAIKNDNANVIINRASNSLFVGLNFAVAFTKMSEINVKLYPNGEIHSKCALRN